MVAFKMQTLLAKLNGNVENKLFATANPTLKQCDMLFTKSSAFRNISCWNINYSSRPLSTFDVQASQSLLLQYIICIFDHNLHRSCDASHLKLPTHHLTILIHGIYSCFSFLECFSLFVAYIHFSKCCIIQLVFRRFLLAKGQTITKN